MKFLFKRLALASIWALLGNSVSALNLTISGTPGNYGMPEPMGYGVNTGLALNASITNAVGTPVEAAGGVRWLCTGWSLYGGTNLLQQDSGTQAVFDLSATNLTLTWRWTNEFKLTALAGPDGGLTADPSGWYAPGTPVMLEAEAAPGYVFSQWTGLVPDGRHRELPLTLGMDRSRTVTVHFASQAGVTKIGTGYGDWGDDSLWTPAGMPGPNDNVELYAATSLLAYPVWAGNVVLSNGATLVFKDWSTGLNAKDVRIMAGGRMTPFTNTFYPSIETNRVLIACENLTIDLGGAVEASGYGYRGTNGPGKGGSAAAGNGGGGGGHGGQGGNGGAGGTTTPALRGAAYDSADEPLLPGSGGGAPSTSPRGGAGGGVGHLFVTNHFRLDGQVMVNGQTGMVAYAGGGAGGAILVVCGSFDGGTGGLLAANGGNGSVTLSRGGGGGGGRIAVWVGVSEAARRAFVDESVSDTIVPYGTYPWFRGQMLVNRGNGFTNLSAEAGTVRIYGSTSEWVLDVDGVPAEYGHPEPLSYGSHFRLPADSWVTNTVPDSWIDLGGGRVRHCTGWKLVAGGDPVAASGSTQAVFQITTNLSLVWQWTNMYHLTAAAGPNGALAADVGGWYTNAVRVRVEAVPAPGSLFSQWTGDVPVEQRQDNPLDLLMDGPRSIRARFSSEAGEVKQSTGQATWTNDAAWLPEGMPGVNDTVQLTRTTNVITEAVWAGDVAVSNGALVRFEGSSAALNAGDVRVYTNGILRSETNSIWPNPVTNRIWVSCRNLTIYQGGLLDGLYKGWAPTNGPGAGGYAAGNDGGGGGGYGGRGGHGNNGGTGARGPVYGSEWEPFEPGSGGGYRISSWPPGAGGGLVQLFVEQFFTLDGTINVNGQTSLSGYCAGGSGGGVFIVCGRFSGAVTGKILADGGAGGTSGNPRRAGGGGGGRIAIWAGVAESTRREVVDEGVVKRVSISTNSHASFRGTLSVYRGEGNIVNNAIAESGTIRVYTPPLNSGTMIFIR